MFVLFFGLSSFRSLFLIFSSKCVVVTDRGEYLVLQKEKKGSYDVRVLLLEKIMTVN